MDQSQQASLPSVSRTLLYSVLRALSALLVLVVLYVAVSLFIIYQAGKREEQALMAIKEIPQDYAGPVKTKAALSIGCRSVTMPVPWIPQSVMSRAPWLRRVVWLDASAMEVLPESLAGLGALTQLETLDLMSSPIDDSVLKFIEPLRKLRILDLTATQITDQGLASLRHIKSLTELSLSETQIGDAGLNHLKLLSNLVRLELRETQVSDRGLEALGAMSSLSELELDSTLVSDAGLVHLSGLKNLRGLSLGGTETTEDGRESLRAALPGCNVFPSP